MENTKYRVETFPFNTIKVDPYLTPEYMEVRSFVASNTKRIEQFVDLIGDFRFQDPLKVFEYEGDVFLLDDYDYYKALESVHGISNARIYCIVIEKVTYRFDKKLSLRLQNIKGLGGQEARILNLKALVEVNCELKEIRQIYGVKKSKSAEGKQLQRDYKLVNCDTLLNRVLGITLTQQNCSIFDRIQRPHVRTVTLSYRFALEIISILNENQEFIQKFDLQYELYLRELKEHHLFDGEITRPVSSWSKYNRNHVRAIACAIARDGARTSYDLDLLNGGPDTLDQSWSVTLNEQTKDLTLPRIQVNLAKKADGNLKKIVDLHYRLRALHFSFESYLKRISPVEHGKKIRNQSSDIAPSFETQSNTPKIEDFSYFDIIFKFKTLYYCDRERLLKSIGLKAHLFGFGSYAPSAVSSFEKAHSLFEVWYKDSFLKRIELFQGGREEGHRLFGIYASIRSFLVLNAQDKSDVLFADFMISTFHKVFSDIAVAREKRDAELQSIRRMDNQVRDSSLEKVLAAIKSSEITEEQLLKAARELILPDEDRLISGIQKLELNIQALTKNMEDQG